MIVSWHKRIISLICFVSLLVSLTGCAPGDIAAVDTTKLKIGVSIWNTTDILGSKTKDIIEETAGVLGVELEWVEHDYDKSSVRSSVERLCEAGCDGILFYAPDEGYMRDAIRTCNSNRVYLAQYYSYIDLKSTPDIYALAMSSPYYVGAVYEDEVENGYRLAYYLLNDGDRRIGVLRSIEDELVFEKRFRGAMMAVEEWNNAHPDDQAYLFGNVTCEDSHKSCNAAVDLLLAGDPGMDGLFVGNESLVVGAMGALRDHRLTDSVDLVGSGFLNDLKKQLKRGDICAQSGGNICDPMFAFILLYKTLRGEVEKPAYRSGYELKCSYIYISSRDEYDEYEKYFVSTMPYSDDEIRDLSVWYTPYELSEAAGILSIRDVMTRHGNIKEKSK